MPSPASNIALTILGITALVAVVSWFLKSKVKLFVEALFAHRSKAANAQEEAANTTAANA
ncbi:hypothetical protein AAL_04050 [Moelleriella libera RCEF 2490]|uniref:Uncharacterized protein n=1 Tax=Moelleriella libera RCEF 2490 TaxID=1081109 RepID=A0A168CNF6_9HYPO|nr:hypothetical protein AAL_04050 [Moelleriella libera RCEF 2490]